MRMEVSQEHLETVGFVVVTSNMCRVYKSSRGYLANIGIRSWCRGRS